MVILPGHVPVRSGTEYNPTAVPSWNFFHSLVRYRCRVGYGIKSFFLNYLQTDESFDIVLFNSTKGECWYRAVFSLPDFERRQGTVYPLALDLTIDYDKWIGYNFFGEGTHPLTRTKKPIQGSHSRCPPS